MRWVSSLRARWPTAATWASTDAAAAALAALCQRNGFAAADIPVFLGAFTSVTLIGANEPVPDEDVALPPRRDPGKGNQS